MTATGAMIGYGRTSTLEQKAGLDYQVAELQAAGCTRIFSEQISGAENVSPGTSTHQPGDG